MESRTICTPREIKANFGFYYDKCKENPYMGALYGPYIANMILHNTNACTGSLDDIVNHVVDKKELSIFDMLVIYAWVAIAVAQTDASIRLAAKKKVSAALVKISASVTDKSDFDKFRESVIRHISGSPNMENTITACAPIVPYAGTIVAPGMETPPAKEIPNNGKMSRVGIKEFFDAAKAYLIKYNLLVVASGEDYIRSNAELIDAISDCKKHAGESEYEYKWFFITAYYAAFCKDNLVNEIATGKIFEQDMESFLDNVEMFAASAPDTLQKDGIIEDEEPDNLSASSKNIEHSANADEPGVHIKKLLDYIHGKRQYVGSRQRAGIILGKIPGDVRISRIESGDILFAVVNGDKLVAVIFDAATAYSPKIVVCDRNGNITEHDDPRTI